ncbi:MAG: hypothetical protein RJA57_755 [Bacteroidota bacterium]
MRNTTAITILLLFALPLLTACSKKSDNGGGATADCSTVNNKAFAADITPIFQANCSLAGCHASGSNSGPGALVTYAQISSAKSSIRASVVNGSMPQGRSLTAAQKNSIICWIDSGAPNN